MMKTLKVMYSGQKSARLYYEVLIQDDNKPICCEKWETKLNTDINWNTGFKKKKNTKNPGNKIEVVPDQTGTKDFSDKCCNVRGC